MKKIVSNRSFKELKCVLCLYGALLFLSSCVQKTDSENGLLSLKDHLDNRRKALLELQNKPVDSLQPVTIQAKTTAEQRSGTRRMRMRDFQIISDSDTVWDQVLLNLPLLLWPVILQIVISIRRL